MAKFLVRKREIVLFSVEVDAESLEEAIRKAKERPFEDFTAILRQGTEYYAESCPIHSDKDDVPSSIPDDLLEYVEGIFIIEQSGGDDGDGYRCSECNQWSWTKNIDHTTDCSVPKILSKIRDRIVTHHISFEEIQTRTTRQEDNSNDNP
jgi:hypothetical protein